MWISQKTNFDTFEMDELYWFIKNRKGNAMGINRYVMTMLSRIPRQIAGFNVDKSVNSKALQSIVDSVPPANNYCTDGCTVYQDIILGGKHIRNIDNKKDTHNIESSNADLRHYIAGLARKSRCFFRSDETLKAVLAVFIDAYNKFGEAKLKYRVPVVHKSQNPSKHLHKWRYPSFSILDFL